MSQHRKHRGLRTQKVVAVVFAKNGWPYAESAGAGRPGADVTGVPGISLEVKARRGFSPLAWVKQARSYPGLPVVVIRPDGMGEKTVMDWPAMMPLGRLIGLLHEAGYGDSFDNRNSGKQG